jgi:hypothetical protein
MQKYKIQKDNKVLCFFKSKIDLEKLRTNPGIYFLYGGNIEIHKCGQVIAFKQLISHFLSLFKKMAVSNV